MMHLEAVMARWTPAAGTSDDRRTRRAVRRPRVRQIRGAPPW